MNLLGILLLIVIAAICGGLGQSIAGYSMGGCLTSIVIGFIGALIGSWLATELGLGIIWAPVIGGESFPIVWSIIGAAIFSLIVGLITRGRKPN